MSRAAAMLGQVQVALRGGPVPMLAGLTVAGFALTAALPAAFHLSTICGQISVADIPALLAVGAVLPSFPALALGWLAVVSLLGMALWLLLIRTQGASTAAAYNMLNPLSGLALSALLLGVPILPADVVGAAAIVTGLGVALGVRLEKR